MLRAVALLAVIVMVACRVWGSGEKPVEKLRDTNVTVTVLERDGSELLQIATGDITLVAPYIEVNSSTFANCTVRPKDGQVVVQVGKSTMTSSKISFGLNNGSISLENATGISLEK